MRKRIAYSQNFLKDKRLVERLVENSSISKEDIVYEIGAGQGIITEALLNKSKKVVAYEIDQNLSDKLKSKFNNSSLEVVQSDFLNAELPKGSYKVFSNIPFNVSSAIIKKLIETGNPPQEAYLIVQKETALKFVGKPQSKTNSQVSVLLKPWFDLDIVHSFKRTDYFPKPNVDTVLLVIAKKDEALITVKDKYQDFVVYTFNQFKPNVVEGLTELFGKKEAVSLPKQLGFKLNAKPSELTIDNWIGLFQRYLKLKETQKSLVKGTYNKQKSQQKGLKKIHRTRTDKKWKQYKSK